VGNRYHPDRFPLAFIIGEEKGLVFHDGAAQGSAELVVVERSLGLAGYVEVVAGIQCAIAEVFCRAAVKGVGAALGDNVDDRAGIASVFGLEIGEHVQFGNGVDRKNGGRRAEDSSLVNCGIVAVSIIHVGAVEQIVVRAAAGAV